MSAGVGAHSLSAATLEDAARAARFVLFLSGCADSTTYLKNEKTGEVVKCGGFHAVTFAESAIQQREVGAIWSWRSIASARHLALAFRRVDAMCRNPCTVVCSLEYPRVRSAAVSVPSLIGRSGLRSLGKTNRPLPVDW